MGENITPRKDIIILLGPPGSGKGTQAERFSKELNIPHISTGDLFRDHLSRQTELGKRVKGFMESGKLVPDDLVLEMLFDRVSRSDCARGYLLDGFPRTVPQAEALGKFVNPKDRMIALNLNVHDEVITKRVAGRLTCKKGGHIFNKYFSPPKIDNICDICGGEIFQRPDDAAEVVNERLKVYHKQTQPLVEYYEKKGLLSHIQGENDPDTVHQDLLKALKG